MNSKRPVIHEQFLKDLAAVLEPPSLPPSFVCDLDGVIADLDCRESLMPGMDTTLHQLAELLPDRKRLVVEKVRQKIRSFREQNAVHPLFCPFDLFKVVGMSRRETAHTYALTHLLDPRAPHGKGAELLKALFEFCGPASERLPVEDFDKAEVVAEAPIGKFGRLDICAIVRGPAGAEHDGRRILIVEAKLDAREGERQLERYDDWVDEGCQPEGVKKHRGRPPLEVRKLFLTIDGKRPTTVRGSDAGDSSVKAVRAGWHCRTFFELAQGFWHLAEEESWHDPARETLRFYAAGVMSSLYGLRLPPPGQEIDLVYAVRANGWIEPEST